MHLSLSPIYTHTYINERPFTAVEETLHTKARRGRHLSHDNGPHRCSRGVFSRLRSARQVSPDLPGDKIASKRACCVRLTKGRCVRGEREECTCLGSDAGFQRMASHRPAGRGYRRCRPGALPPTSSTVYTVLSSGTGEQRKRERSALRRIYAQPISSERLAPRLRAGVCRELPPWGYVRAKGERR